MPNLLSEYKAKEDALRILLESPGLTISPTTLSKVLGGNPYTYNMMAKAGLLTIPHIWRGRNLRIIKEPIIQLLGGTYDPNRNQR